MDIILFLCLIVIAGISKAVMDVLQFRFSRSIFNKFKNYTWWNPAISWRNKWKNGDHLQGERFWGSSRWFVRFTDAWHFFQGIMLTTIFIAMVIYPIVFFPLVDFALIYLLFTSTFSLFYNIIFINK